jgi:hypothetical protein
MTERQAFWLTPLAATLPLVPLFSLPASPWFLGGITPGMGPWLSAAGVVFDGVILGYVMTYAVALPIYFMLKPQTRMSSWRMLLLFCLTGVAASQVVHAFENFRQPALRAFAEGWISPLFGCLCGATAGLAFTFFRKQKLPGKIEALVYALPAVTVILCGFLLVQSAPQKHRTASSTGFVDRGN